jgi:hypothetical protein
MELIAAKCQRQMMVFEALWLTGLRRDLSFFAQSCEFLRLANGPGTGAIVPYRPAYIVDPSRSSQRMNKDVPSI